MDAEPIDMADLPVQLPAAPASTAAARARFFNSGNAFNIKLPPVPAAEFGATLARAGHPTAPTGTYPCDQGPAMGCAFPATLRATADALLWLVTNQPMLALDGAAPGASPLPAVHCPAAEIERQLALLSGTRANASTSGLALIFSSAGLEAARNLTPSLTLSLNTLPPGQEQRAHRQNSAAVTLAVQGDGCFSTVGGLRCPWTPGSTPVTPPGKPHSHHNPSGVQARFLIVQDGGLHYHARTMGFEFLDQPCEG